MLSINLTATAWETQKSRSQPDFKFLHLLKQGQSTSQELMRTKQDVYGINENETRCLCP